MKVKFDKIVRKVYLKSYFIWDYDAVTTINKTGFKHASIDYRDPDSGMDFILVK